MAALCRNSADAELQAAVAQHAADCKQQLADSTTGVEKLLGQISDDCVMSMEEADVHQVMQFFNESGFQNTLQHQLSIYKGLKQSI